MTHYLFTRLWSAIIVLFGVSVINFAILHVAPGDPLLAILGDTEGNQTLTPEHAAHLRAQWGLNEPLYVQYVQWLGHVLRGDLGRSYLGAQPVSARILAFLPNTLLLSGMALVFALMTGIIVGVIGALRPHSLLDSALTLFNFISLSVPGFIVAIFALYVFAVKLRWFPVAGLQDLTGSAPPLSVVEMLTHRLHHLILPVMALALEPATTFARYTRSSLIETLREDFVTTARAKGLRERRVILVHALRRASLPLITLVGLRLPMLFSGSILIENVFSLPGMGTLTLSAISERDYPLILGILLLLSFIIQAVNIVTDFAYALADPRIRLR